MRFLLGNQVKILKRQLHTRVWEGIPVGSVVGKSGDAECENSHYLDTGRL